MKNITVFKHIPFDAPPNRLIVYDNTRGSHKVWVKPGEVDRQTQATILLEPEYAVFEPFIGFDLNKVYLHFRNKGGHHRKAAELLEEQLPVDGAMTWVLSIPHTGSIYCGAWRVARETADGRQYLKIVGRRVPVR